MFAQGKGHPQLSIIKMQDFRSPQFTRGILTVLSVFNWHGYQKSPDFEAFNLLIDKNFRIICRLLADLRNCINDLATYRVEVSCLCPSSVRSSI